MAASDEFTLTTNLSLKKPDIDLADGEWGNMLNETIETLDDEVPLSRSRDEGLVVKVNTSNPTYQIDIDADHFTVFDASNNAKVLSSVSLTADITVSGANGLDTGLEADVWYFAYIIYNGSTPASLLSANATSPTMPSGYTYKRFVGAVYNTSGNFRAFYQNHNEAYFGRSVLQALGTSTSFATTTYYSTFIPTAHVRQIRGDITCRIASGNPDEFVQLSPDGTIGTVYQEYYNAGSVGGLNYINTPFSMAVKKDATSLYYKVGSSQYGSVNVHGYTLNL